MTAKQASEIFLNKTNGKEKIFAIYESLHFFHIFTKESASGNMCLPFAHVNKATGKFSTFEDFEEPHSETGYDEMKKIPADQYQ